MIFLSIQRKIIKTSYKEDLIKVGFYSIKWILENEMRKLNLLLKQNLNSIIFFNKNLS